MGLCNFSYFPLFSSFHFQIYMLSVNSQTPRINARGSQDSQSQRVKTAVKSTVDIKNPHTVNKKDESWRRARGTAAPGSCKMNTLHKKF
jgi:hypothetical protein